ncbi:hypothetical protein ACOSP7_003773 [Xanthoceras sorbifolium]
MNIGCGSVQEDQLRANCLAIARLTASLPQLFNFSFPLTSSHTSLPQLLASSSPSHASIACLFFIAVARLFVIAEQQLLHRRRTPQLLTPPTSETESHA